jgi:hypothetical protein
MPLEENEIRPLEISPGDDENLIQCRFHIVSLNEEEQVTYGALSYTWGGAGTDKKVLIDGKSSL